MAEQYGLDIEGSHVPRMRLLKPFEIGQLGGLRRAEPPARSIVEIPKFSGQDNKHILEWLEHWNQVATANGWSQENESVLFPLYIVGRALQYF